MLNIGRHYTVVFRALAIWKLGQLTLCMISVCEVIFYATSVDSKAHINWSQKQEFKSNIFQRYATQLRE